jgi:hypothetical protein
LKARSLRDFAAKQAGSELADRALASLYFDLSENRHHVAVELVEVETTAGAERAAGRSGGSQERHVALLIKVPINELTLMPVHNEHLGQLSLAVAAQGEAGGASPPQQARVPIRIANSELLAAMSRVAGARLDLVLGPDRQKIAIAVRDDLSGGSSTLNLVVEAEAQRTKHRRLKH